MKNVLNLYNASNYDDKNSSKSLTSGRSSKKKSQRSKKHHDHLKSHFHPEKSHKNEHEHELSSKNSVNKKKKFATKNLSRKETKKRTVVTR